MVYLIGTLLCSSRNLSVTLITNLQIPFIFSKQIVFYRLCIHIPALKIFCLMKNTDIHPLLSALWQSCSDTCSGGRDYPCASRTGLQSSCLRWHQALAACRFVQAGGDGGGNWQSCAGCSSHGHLCWRWCLRPSSSTCTHQGFCVSGVWNTTSDMDNWKLTAFRFLCGGFVCVLLLFH